MSRIECLLHFVARGGRLACKKPASYSGPACQPSPHTGPLPTCLTLPDARENQRSVAVQAKNGARVRDELEKQSAHLSEAVRLGVGSCGAILPAMRSPPQMVPYECPFFSGSSKASRIAVEFSSLNFLFDKCSDRFFCHKRMSSSGGCKKILKEGMYTFWAGPP